MLLCGAELSGKRLGIVDMGRIGKAVAEKVRGFDPGALNRSTHPEESEGTYVSLDSLLSRSDIVSLHLPLTRTTHHLIGTRELSLMKREAHLIDTSRGSVVDERALVRALRKKIIAGARLDMYEHEPSVTRGFLPKRNVVLLPHVGSATIETRRRMASLAATNPKEHSEGGHRLTW